ncbi:gliding motility-associated C-terminal domain-containing protein [Aquimarina sp. W85]|uniref:gliding motility-associated C-terminal domain-containing protein n=1 Tax=Aquimarina rhodophyticola TaxID=3342246 RepID=UPI00367253B6
MKALISNILILVMLCSLSLKGQEAFHNFGNIQIHEQGAIGFHIDLINDGRFNENLGMVGFYNSNGRLTVSGTEKPVFYDLEIDVDDNLYLEVAVGSTNFQEFINGRVITPRDQSIVSLDYDIDTPYLGANDDRFVDGYAAITGALDFTFPIGDDFRLRPMAIEPEAATNTARGAYFFEDPNNPNFFPKGFDTANYEATLYGVSIFEFWDLNGSIETKVTLTWDDNSNLPTLVENLENLRVVGWDTEQNTWINLGNTGVRGDLNNGEIVSAPFIPDTYTIITFGSSSELLDGDFEVFNAVSPNGDGINDTFVIQGLTAFPDNTLEIFNRWGVKVYEKNEYHKVQETSEGFAGRSNGRATILDNSELPVGTYFYVVKINGRKSLSGYLYINR